MAAYSIVLWGVSVEKWPDWPWRISWWVFNRKRLLPVLCELGVDCYLLYNPMYIFLDSCHLQCVCLVPVTLVWIMSFGLHWKQHLPIHYFQLCLRCYIERCHMMSIVWVLLCCWECNAKNREMSVTVQNVVQFVSDSLLTKKVIPRSGTMVSLRECPSVGGCVDFLGEGWADFLFWLVWLATKTH